MLVLRLLPPFRPVLGTTPGSGAAHLPSLIHSRNCLTDLPDESFPVDSKSHLAVEKEPSHGQCLSGAAVTQI